MTDVDWPRKVGSAVLAAVTAFIANLIVVLVARQTIAVPAGFRPFNAGALAVSSIIAAAGAMVVLGVKKYWCGDCYRKGFLYIAASVLTLSFLTIFLQPAVFTLGSSTLAVKLATATGVLHVVTGFAITATLLERDRRA